MKWKWYKGWYFKQMFQKASWTDLRNIGQMQFLRLFGNTVNKYQAEVCASTNPHIGGVDTEDLFNFSRSIRKIKPEKRNNVIFEFLVDKLTNITASLNKGDICWGGKADKGLILVIEDLTKIVQGFPLNFELLLSKEEFSRTLAPLRDGVLALYDKLYPLTGNSKLGLIRDLRNCVNDNISTLEVFTREVKDHAKRESRIHYHTKIVDNRKNFSKPDQEVPKTKNDTAKPFTQASKFKSLSDAKMHTVSNSNSGSPQNVMSSQQNKTDANAWASYAMHEILLAWKQPEITGYQRFHRLVSLIEQKKATSSTWAAMEQAYRSWRKDLTLASENTSQYERIACEFYHQLWHAVRRGNGTVLDLDRQRMEDYLQNSGFHLTSIGTIDTSLAGTDRITEMGQQILAESKFMRPHLRQGLLQYINTLQYGFNHTNPTTFRTSIAIKGFLFYVKKNDGDPGVDIINNFIGGTRIELSQSSNWLRMYELEDLKQRLHIMVSETEEKFDACSIRP